MDEYNYTQVKNEVEGVKEIPEVPKPLPTNQTKELPKISEIAKEPYLKPEKPEKKYFWKIYVIVITLLFIACVCGAGYLIYNSDFRPQFNSTSQIDNQYDIDVTPSINSPVTANLDNQFENKFEFTFDLSDEFIAEVCG